MIYKVAFRRTVIKMFSSPELCDKVNSYKTKTIMKQEEQVIIGRKVQFSPACNTVLCGN